MAAKCDDYLLQKKLLLNRFTIVDGANTEAVAERVLHFLCEYRRTNKYTASEISNFVNAFYSLKPLYDNATQLLLCIHKDKQLTVLTNDAGGYLVGPICSGFLSCKTLDVLYDFRPWHYECYYQDNGKVIRSIRSWRIGKGEIQHANARAPFPFENEVFYKELRRGHPIPISEVEKFTRELFGLPMPYSSDFAAHVEKCILFSLRKPKGARRVPVELEKELLTIPYNSGKFSVSRPGGILRRVLGLFPKPCRESSSVRSAFDEEVPEVIQVEFFRGHAPSHLTSSVGDADREWGMMTCNKYGEYVSFFAVKCTCGAKGLSLDEEYLSGTVDDENSGNSEPAWIGTRLSCVCNSCRRSKVVFDSTKHGVSRRGAPSLPVSVGLKNPLRCESCGCRSMNVFVAFQYSGYEQGVIDELNVTCGVEDLFEWFSLGGRCSQCGWIGELRSCECT